MLIEPLNEKQEVALRSAILLWLTREGRNSDRLRRMRHFDALQLDRWLADWMLARSVPRRVRPKLLSFLNKTAISRLLNCHRANNTSWRIVEDLACKAKHAAYLNGQPTSLISKLAFSLQPKIFAPYDARVRCALRQAGYKVPDHQYCNYMTCFVRETEKLIEELRRSGVTDTTLQMFAAFIVNQLIESGDNTNQALCENLDQDLIKLRYADKYLMLNGGFNLDRMKRDYLRFVTKAVLVNAKMLQTDAARAIALVVC